MNKLQKHHYFQFGRFALALIYIWFGALKVLNMSPAEGLVRELLSVTMPDIPFMAFYLFFGIAEMLLGILFLVPKYSKITLMLFLAHMATTFLPLYLLRDAAWQYPMVYTIEGQYIVKNLALISLALIVLQERDFLKK